MNETITIAATNRYNPILEFLSIRYPLTGKKSAKKYSAAKSHTRSMAF